jgi:toxin secretion/phage lysis holin
MEVVIMKQSIFSFGIGAIGGFITTLYGGWSAGMTTLVLFMAIDYLSGLTVAGVFKQSPKSKTGALESRAGFKGLCRKGMTLLIVLVAYRLDLLIGTNYVKDAVIIGFCVNELLSIIENAGLMGLPLPPVIVKALDILKSKSESCQKQQ